MAELLAVDQDDESLRKYKEALLGAAAHGDLGDPRYELTGPIFVTKLVYIVIVTQEKLLLPNSGSCLNLRRISLI